MLCSNFTRTPASGRRRLLSDFGFYVIQRNYLLARRNKDAHACPVGSSSVSVAIKISSSAVVSGISQHPVCLRLAALVRVAIQVGRRPQETLLGLKATQTSTRHWSSSARVHHPYPPTLRPSYSGRVPV